MRRYVILTTAAGHHRSGAYGGVSAAGRVTQGRCWCGRCTRLAASGWIIRWVYVAITTALLALAAISGNAIERIYFGPAPPAPGSGWPGRFWVMRASPRCLCARGDAGVRVAMGAVILANRARGAPISRGLSPRRKMSNDSRYISQDARTFANWIGSVPNIGFSCLKIRISNPPPSLTLSINTPFVCN